ncbi:cytochrome-c peroxidase [Fibrella aquatilis]|uniref:Cytochrome c domain-containing protein n=1 Tax=Fibrella aquatilis TaxID=2817059 RepID=A0A939G3A2_9BACT|nr:cytochrome c peroxidase [Fibrella aquatilis]MBO0929819.1 hypothetical protein [Fibrella aquatilis]
MFTLLVNTCIHYVLLLAFCLAPVLLTAQPASKIDAVELGRMLFFDPVLSGNYKRSCASCHRPQKAFTDQRVTARAYAFAQNLAINTPTLLGAARQRTFFHDGRAGSLALVIQSVLTNPTELNSSYAQLTARLSSSRTYRTWFEQVYSQKPSEQTINKALIAYLNQLASSGNRAVESPPVATNAAAQLFADAGCGTCHPAPTYRDGKRHEVAPGRWVRTPGLRYLPLTPPYLADGTAPTLEAVLTSPFHARQRLVNVANQKRLVLFLNSLPADTTGLASAMPSALPDIPGAPTRRVGGSY